MPCASLSQLIICRWKATALRQGDWESWFQTQMKTANKKPEKGLYVSLRMDGRVRGSGVGSPPWDRLAVALPPVSGTQYKICHFCCFWMTGFSHTECQARLGMAQLVAVLQFCDSATPRVLLSLAVRVFVCLAGNAA